MQTRSVLIAILACASVSLNGCAVYTVASVGAFATTGKSISDHGTSLVTRGDCNVTHPFKGQYYCEMPVVYNQNGL